MDSLTEIYKRHSSPDYLKASDKGTIHTYIDTYEKLFGPYRDKPIDLLEVGVASGHSLLMWEEYFSKANIYGMDLLPKPVILNNHPRIVYTRFNSTDYRVLDSTSLYDIIIDDGCHEFDSQLATACLLFQKVKPGGIYIIEDVKRPQAFAYFKVLGVTSVYGSLKGNDRLIVINKPKV